MNNNDAMAPAILTPENFELEVIETKKRQWGLMGVKIYKQELELQVRAQQALKKLETLPATIQEVPAAEQALKEVSAIKRQIEIDRKAITSKFDPVFDRLMQPEKSFAVAMHSFSSAIISLKRIEEQKAQERQYKADELAKIRQVLITSQAQADAEFKTLIAERIGQAFAHALEKGIKPEEKEDYLDRVKFKIKESLFEVQPPELQLQFVTAEESRQVIEGLWSINPASYVALFASELDRKFADYNVAFLNKQEALRQSRELQAMRMQQIKEQQQATETAASLDATATDLSIEPTGLKALKKCYEVDMPETYENAMKIFSAFMANKQRCLDKVNINKWFSFTATSAAKALAKVKSEDNLFAPQGIIFKEVDKL
jgi:hypothetical protein